MVTDKKEKLKEKDVSYIKSYVRQKQDGKVFYIIFKNSSKVNAIKIKSTKNIKKVISDAKSIKKGEF